MMSGWSSSVPGWRGGQIYSSKKQMNMGNNLIKEEAPGAAFRAVLMEFKEHLSTYRANAQSRWCGGKLPDAGPDWGEDAALMQWEALDGNDESLLKHLDKLWETVTHIEYILVDGEGTELTYQLINLETPLDPLNELQAKLCSILSNWDEFLGDMTLDEVQKSLHEKSVWTYEALLRMHLNRREDEAERKTIMAKIQEYKEEKDIEKQSEKTIWLRDYFDKRWG
jgi:hypothetical protein